MKGMAAPNQLPQSCFRIFCVLALVLSAIGSVPSAAQSVRSLLPVDEATTRPDFFTFRAHLQATLAQHDLNALLEVVHPNIKWLPFGWIGHLLLCKILLN